jgi:hypothetical protein
VYVIPDPEDHSVLHFCDYIGIEGLKNTEGYAYDQYYIIVTGVINSKGIMQFFVNGLPDFKVPGKYPLGKEVKDAASANKHVNMLFDHNNFVADFEKQPLPMDTDRANTAGIPNIKGVESVKVENDEVIVILQPNIKTEKTATNVMIDVQGRLNSIVNAKSNAKIFQHKFVARGGKKAIKFILIPNIGRKMNVSIQQLHDVSEQMGFTDKQKAALRFALQH